MEAVPIIKRGFTPLEIPKTLEQKAKSLTGFTVIELSVAAVIVTLILLVLFYTSFTIQDNIGITTDILTISEKGRFAINRISKDIREAKSVLASYSPYATNNTTVILRVPSINAAGNVIDPETYFDTIIFTLDSANPERLLRIVDADSISSRVDATETINQTVNTLLFSSEGTSLSSVADKGAIKTVTVKLITEASLAGISRTNEIVTSISLRNKNIGL